ncbi:transcriptional regulator BpuR [Borreliella andersonii]|uniref:transcriptional regulator BpuR n=1 Tax=Borrelia andersonii TaxID=42109 RepID=UPI00292D8BB7|nr:transcriptional regulator BpuR [Borreliella andersonii]WNY69944.1 transcriptional regulator BpuR [Borreliella andersonii]
MGERGEVYSEKLFTESERTYFFNVKENRKGDYFLNIVESKRSPSGDFERHSIFVYEENISEFESNLLKAIAVIKQKVSTGPGGASARHSKGYGEYGERSKLDDSRFDKKSHLSGGRFKKKDY